VLGLRVAAVSTYTLGDYLREPCDECDRPAENNGISKATGRYGKLCNGHVDWDRPGFARND
jgi:hypothetical protein